MNRKIRITLLAAAIWFTLVSSVCGQRLYFGVAGGTNLTSNFPGRDLSGPADDYGNPAWRFQYLNGSRSFIFGTVVEGRLSESLSIEANVLHRPLNATIINASFPATGPSVVSTDHFTAVRAWEFPVMLKYTLPSLRSDGRLRPFIAAGPSFRTQEDASATEPSQFGFSAGAGVALYVGRLRIAPGLRYTRWTRESIDPRYETKPDQLEFLTSVTYETDSLTRRLAGRRLEFGAIAGLPFLRGFDKDYFGGAIVERPRFLAGITAQTKVAGNFSIEVDAIYKLLRAGSPTPNVQEPFSVVTWQFPVLAKYAWGESRWRPFAEAGPSFRLAGNLNGYNPSHYGVTAGGGLETRAHGVRLSGALRYTRWAEDESPYRLPAGVHWTYPRTNANAVELIFGVSF